MRFLLLTGTALIAIAGAPAYAQQAPPPSTGDPVLDRLNALEARVKQLEARNAELERQAAATTTRVEAAEKRESKQVQFGFAPTLSDDKGDFTFKPRGVIEADYGVFNERAGGYDYNDGTAFRRARIGLEGTALKVFNYRIEVDFAGNQVGITDAYLQYAGIEDLLITAGQHKAPFGLESNNSDNYNIFLERGMFTNAFGNAGAERRIGLSAAYAPGRISIWRPACSATMRASPARRGRRSPIRPTKASAETRASPGSRCSRRAGSSTSARPAITGPV